MAMKDENVILRVNKLTRIALEVALHTKDDLLKPQFGSNGKNVNQN